jgi:hypothetical protein
MANTRSRQKRRVVNFQVDEVEQRMIDFLRYQVHGGKLKAAMSQAIRDDALRYGYLDWIARLDVIEQDKREREEQLV